jgi:hypothetical protein
MRCITVRPPWSWAILHGKDVENRTWRHPHRGRLAIHAGRRWDVDGQDSPLIREAWRNAGHDLRALSPNNSRVPLGAVVAVAEMVGCHEDGDVASGCEPVFGCSPWAARGQYHWRLASVRPLPEPVPCRGALGLWTLPDDIEAAVRAQLGERADA